MSRLDRGTGIRHRPATALTDTLATKDPIAQALWQEQRERTLASIKRIRAGLPSPRLPIHDPWALRALVMVMLVAAYVAAGDERTHADCRGVRLERRAGAGQRPGRCLGDAAGLYRQAAGHSVRGQPGCGFARQRAPLPVPSGSTLLVRSSGGTIDVVVGGGVTEVAPSEQAPKGTNERHFKIAGDGTAHVRAPAGQPLWRFAATPDRAPTHFAGQGSGTPGPRLAADVLQARGRLRRHRSARAIRRPHRAMRPRKLTRKPIRTARARRPTSAEPRPLFEPPQFALVLPNARTRNGVGQTVKDLSEDPYAGADVTLTLTAKDEAGNEGKSEPFNMRLPERLFTKPLARALIEQRRILALDANQNAQVYTALDALMIAPELFTPETGHYLGLFSVARQLEAARTDDALREVVASLWALAVTIEDGNISDVDKALRAAQEALKQALERGATDEEIKKLTDNLRAALDNFLRQLAEQLKNNPQQLARPLDPNTKMLSQQDLKSMLDRLERMSRSGDKDAAKQLLEQLQQMLENLQMAQPGQGGDDMEQALNELGDMIRKQQQLRDKTFKQGQDSRRDRMRGKQGDQKHGRPAAGPAGPARPAEEIAGRTRQARHGAGPARRARAAAARRTAGQQGQGQQGQGGDQGDGEDGLDQADSAMGDATGRLGEGNADGAVGLAGPRAGRAAQGRPEPGGSHAAGRRRPAGRRPRQSQGPPAGRGQLDRSARPADAPQRIHRRLFGEDPRRDRRAAGAPDPRRTAPPSRRSGPPADRARLHRAAAEGLLRAQRSCSHRSCHHPRRRVTQYSRDVSD